THGSPVNFSGKLYNPHFYGVDKESGLIDWEKVALKAHEVRPKLMICGASAYSRDWNYARLRQIADEVGAILMADISHPSGLIATGLLNHPFPHCHIVTSTTHKTLRGPRGGIIMMAKDFPNPMGVKNAKGELRSMSSLLDSGVFPGTQGGPLEHIIAAKAIAFGEALEPAYQQYTRQVKANALALALAMTQRGYQIISGGTDNHLMLIDLRNKSCTGKAAEQALGKAHITINKNMVPFDTASPMITSGIRLGTPAITTRGLQESQMDQVADWIDRAIQGHDNEGVLKRIGQEVCALMEQLPLYVA
ncbi:MAG: serine hydroxymethyltransferase, partial [Sphingomonadales bacterium]|nr:serine hydroxymethyltransferase [Sphingomonadales bacterium]